MKKTILTIVISLISSATFAQVKIEAGQNEREKLAPLSLTLVFRCRVDSAELTLALPALAPLSYQLYFLSSSELPFC